MNLAVPYFKQLDNHSGTGWRECFSSSCAMLAAFYGKVKSDDEYNIRRARYGDTTSVTAQLLALKSYGLRPIFSRYGSRSTIENYIKAGRPVAVGWLHKGFTYSPWGGGHWSVAIGSSKSHIVLHDPYGEPRVFTGGHIPFSSGAGIPCSWANWKPRWCVEGDRSGWYVVCL